MSFHFTHDATQLNQPQSSALVLQKFICIDSNARNPIFLYLYKYNLAALFCEDNNKPVFIIYHSSSYELWHHWLLCSPVKHLVLFQLHDHVDFKCNIIVYTSQGLYYTARWKQFYRRWITCEKAIVTIHICYKHFTLHKPVRGQKVFFHFYADCTSLNQVDTVWFLLDRAMLNVPKVQLWQKALCYSSFLDS